MRTSPLSFAIVLALVSVPAAAQPAGQVEFEVPLRWFAGEAGVTDQQQDLAATLGLEHLMAGERVRVFYDLDVNAFGTQESLRTWLHNGGATVTWGSPRRALDVGGAVFRRTNDGTWADAGFKGANVLTSLRLQPRSGLAIAASYALYARTFADQPALDQYEHVVSTRLLANFPTRTTLLGAVSLGGKRYDGRVVTVADEAPTYTSTVRAGGRGWRQGLLAPARVDVVGAPAARRQWTWAVRLAQSLDERTGVWIEREERRIGGELPPAIVWTPPLFYDDGVYDDPYVIDARSWRAGAKHVFASGFELSAWASRAKRAYAGLLRADVLSRAGAEGAMPILDRARFALEVIARYGYFENESSDLQEGYRAHQASVGVRVAF
jgi:hypothetical protein